MPPRKRKTVNYNEDSDYEEERPRILGHIYIVSDASWNNKKFKIGITKLDIDRLVTRYNTSYGKCEVQYFKDTYEFTKAEKLIHNILDNFRVGTTEVFDNLSIIIARTLCDSVIKVLDSIDTDNISIVGINKRKIRKMEITDADTSKNDNLESKVPLDLWHKILADIVNKLKLSYFIYCPLSSIDAIKKINDDYTKKRMKEHCQVIKQNISNDDFKKIIYFKNNLESWDKLVSDYKNYCSNNGDNEPIDKIDLLLEICS